MDLALIKPRSKEKRVTNFLSFLNNSIGFVSPMASLTYLSVLSCDYTIEHAELEFTKGLFEFTCQYCYMMTAKKSGNKE